MRKPMAFILALILLFTMSGAALASSINTSKAELQGGYEAYNGSSNATTAKDMFIDKNGDSQQETDVYVKVRATGGQIDATVPLIIVISTDISGTTKALTPSNYEIKSYSSVDLRVTDIDVAVSAPDQSTGVEWVLADSSVLDDIGASGIGRWDSVEGNDSTWNAKLNSMTTYGAKNAIALSLKGLVLDAENDLTDIDDIDPLDGKAADNTFMISKINSTETVQSLDLDLQVRTSKLNFVTYNETPGSSNGDPDKGVHALKITYTIDADVEDNYKIEDIVIDHDSAHTP